MKNRKELNKLVFTNRSTDHTIKYAIRTPSVNHNQALTSKANDSHLDREKYIEEGIKLKKHIQQLENHTNSLKIDNTRLFEENKRLIHTIKDILIKSNKSDIELMNYYEDAIQGVESTMKFQLQNEDYYKLKEVYLLANLKNQVISLRKLLNERDERIKYLLTTEKILNYSRMEHLLNHCRSELNELSDKYKNLKSLFDQTSSQLSLKTNEAEDYKSKYFRYRKYFENAKSNQLDDKKELDKRIDKQREDNKRIKSTDTSPINRLRLDCMKREIKTLKLKILEKNKSDGHKQQSSEVDQMKDSKLLQEANQKIKELNTINRGLINRISNLEKTLSSTDNEPLKPQITQLKSENENLKKSLADKSKLCQTLENELSVQTAKSKGNFPLY